jgi:hypothetical protein
MKKELFPKIILSLAKEPAFELLETFLLSLL